MIKLFDRIVISFSIFFITLILSYYLLKNIYLALTLTFLIICMIIISKKLYNKSNKHLYNCNKFVNYLIIMGKNYYVNFICNFINNEDKIKKDNYIIIDNEIIYPILKFSQINNENIANIYQIMKENNYEKTYLIYHSIDRNALILAHNLNINIELINIEKIYKYLKKNNLLPKIDMIKHEKKSKLQFKILLKSIFNRQNSKYYIISSLMLILLSFISPIKKYYFIMGIILFVLFLITLFIKNDFIDNDSSEFTKKYLKNKNNLK